MCRECAHNVKLKAIWGCETNTLLPVPTAVIDGSDCTYELMSCPRQYIPKQVMELVEMYDDLKNLVNIKLPEYDEISARFLEAIRIFECECKSVTAQQQKED